LTDLAAFRRDGYVYVRGAFSAADAAAMRDVVWAELESRGMRRDDPATWREEFTSHLQHLKRNPVFAAVGSPATIAAIDELLGEGAWRRPRDWGAFFLLFPTGREWNVPADGWHVDHDWYAPAEPLRELKVQAMFGDIEPRAGGMTIVAGSHRVVEQLVVAAGLGPGVKAEKIRHAVMAGHPYLEALSGGGAPADRITRFVDCEEDVLGAPCRVVELTATAGDVVLIHPLVLHTRPTNAGSAPRFMLNKDLYA
jgi:hypothetical protein